MKSSFEGSGMGTSPSPTLTGCKFLKNPLEVPGSSHCPRIFDTILCWDETPSGTIAEEPCPQRPEVGWGGDGKATKYCTENGTWWRHPLSNLSWSNYTDCVVDVSPAWNHAIIVQLTGNSLSLIACCVGLFIFFYFRQLSCNRVLVHKNLFFSFIITNAVWIFWYKRVLTPDVLKEGPIWCQVVHVIVHYFTVTNYFWMFCEGLYLHTLLVFAFVSEEKVIRYLYAVGWGLPAIIVTIYGVARGVEGSYTKSCWVDESPFNNIYTVPVVISIFLNLASLVNIVRVLLTKLRATPSVRGHSLSEAEHQAQQNSHQAKATRKAVRATLILIPLLGLHYIITPFRPDHKYTTGAVVYEFLAAIVSSFQVIGHLRKKYRQLISHFRRNPRRNGVQSMDSYQHHTRFTSETTLRPLTTAGADGNGGNKGSNF
ncbi:unnamed protein product [Cyprideis torosa]|uniref:Uncharacterized protein n=1 Tax=Cyprideis torosa TaxID=163714 RepID=A0A7R8W2Y4_9CRUS|nr:unnamed protein product [Cyprideis torosa]CAG0880207.1 unnamed protein product [Cyprideis torosa]